MNYSVILVVASVAIASATGTLLRCSKQSFDGLGGVLPSSSSGSKFSICSGGLVHEIACPSGQAFDVSSRTCVISHNSNERFNVKSSRQFEDLCTNPNEVQILPNPTNCSQYIICFGLVPIEQSCGYGLLFNPELEVCDIPTNVVCGYSCPKVDDPYNPVWLPDARLEDCSRHYLCFQGNPIQFFCSNNLYFDVVSNTCTYPQYSGCSVPGVWCNTNGTEVVENPRSCTSYYECLEAFPHFRSCPDGEYFSAQMGRCVVGACPPQTGTTTTSVPFTSTTSGTTSNGTSTEASTMHTETTTPTIIEPTTPEATTSETTPIIETTTPETTIITETTTPEMTSISEITTPEPTTTTESTTSETTTVHESTTSETATSPESTTSETTTALESTTSETTTAPESTATTTKTTAESESTTSESTISTTTDTITTTESANESTTTTIATTTVNPLELCAGGVVGVFPMPGNCYQYILCINGIGAISECEQGQIFYQTTLSCVPGDRETCVLG